MNRDLIINKSLLYLKPIIKDDEEDIFILSEVDSMVERSFNEDLSILYLYKDESNNYFKYVQYGDLKEIQTSEEELYENSLNNLMNLCEVQELKMQEFEQGYYGLFLDGNFEASLILIDELWNNNLRQYITTDFAVAIPSRDVIIFCDQDSDTAINEMKLVIERVWEDGDHLLIDRILIRNEGEWTYLE